ncbi:hypothetical protein P6B95_19065 [Streptomyces atratus]|uniref:hypothetical protein n=1 Tax=Streptomyces atratus TaxID=1893 RepID=UPI001670C3D9|nr:hypothetical protein [Streptomyces atratus]WPW29275.1 hypothetical protein P6B95_19065 [Streptomyces atratus]GGT48092.1 hypothetical protein GCM10010207_55980 [Streptomyces atratus]
MSETEPPLTPSADAVRKLLCALAQGVRHDYGLSQALTGELWSVETVLERAADLELIRGRHLTDAGRLLLGGATHPSPRRLIGGAQFSANSASGKRCWCGSCVATGLYDSTAPYYPVSLREGR